MAIPFRAPDDDQRPNAGNGYARIGWIVKSEAQQLSVEFEGSGGARVARSLVAFGKRQLRTVIAKRQPVVLVFEEGDPARPIIVGLLDPADLQTREEAQVIEADVDGKRVRVVAQDEIVLQCGQASVTLRRNGKIVIKGTYVETYSTGTNRIKGGQVRMN